MYKKLIFRTLSNQVCTRYSCAFLTLETMGKLSELNINIELNPISAGVLENQDMLGGGSICFMSKYDK